MEFTHCPKILRFGVCLAFICAWYEGKTKHVETDCLAQSAGGRFAVAYSVVGVLSAAMLAATDLGIGEISPLLRLLVLAGNIIYYSSE